MKVSDAGLMHWI